MAKFQQGNNGKPKGAKNKLTKSVREAFQVAFNQMNADPKKDYSLFEWGKKNPKEFYIIASKLIPLQLTGEDGDPITVNILPVGSRRNNK
jgi:hypothetical protein